MNKNSMKVARQNTDQKSRKIHLINHDIAFTMIFFDVLWIFDLDERTLRLFRGYPRRLGVLAPYLSSATSFGDDFFLPAIVPFCEALVLKLEHLVFVGLFSLHLSKIPIDKLTKKYTINAKS